MQREKEIAMSESFEDRVKRLFGSSLFEAVPKSSFPTSSWSVADGDVERQKWDRERGVRDDREDDPCSSAFYDKDGCLFKNKRSKRDKQREFEGDLDDPDEDEDEEERERERGGEYGEGRDEEEEIRSSIGRDRTLDFEDEEDEYDKAALGKENATERVYMKDVEDHGPYMNYHAVVPDLLAEPSDDADYLKRDPRADHNAASARLREDENRADSSPSILLNRCTEPSGKLLAKIPDHDVNVKPILKRKEAQVDHPKPKKRVRFDPEYTHDHGEVSEEAQDVPMLPKSMENRVADMPEESRGIPDYLRNPSKYTRYSLESSEGIDEENNKRAFEDFWNLVRRSTPDGPQPECPVELPKFRPRKKPVDVVPMDDSPVNLKEKGPTSGFSGGMAAVEAEDSSGACEMDEDNVEAPSVDTNISTRRDRKYRPKSASDGSS